MRVSHGSHTHTRPSHPLHESANCYESQRKTAFSRRRIVYLPTVYIYIYIYIYSATARAAEQANATAITDEAATARSAEQANAPPKTSTARPFEFSVLEHKNWPSPNFEVAIFFRLFIDVMLSDNTRNTKQIMFISD